jgi:hypothetical protein
MRYLVLNIRISYLAIKKVIPEDMSRFFDPFFTGGLSLLQKDIFKKYDKDMNSLKGWCSIKNIIPGPAPEPHPLAKEIIPAGSPIKS